MSLLIIIFYKYNIIINLIMDFDSIKKDKPRLTDYIYLQKVIDSKKPEIIIPAEPTLIDKVYDKCKNSFFQFIEKNLFIIFIVIIIFCLLIYRYYQYQTIKNSFTINFIYWFFPINY